MVQKNCFISFEQKPIFDFSDRIFFTFSLFILLCDRFIDILLFGLVCITRMNNWDLLLLRISNYLNLLNYFLILKINLVHFGWHIKLILWWFLRKTHWSCDIIWLFLFFCKQVEIKYLFPWNPFFWSIF